MSNIKKKEIRRLKARQLLVSELNFTCCRAAELEKGAWESSHTKLQYTQCIRKLLFNLKTINYTNEPVDCTIKRTHVNWLALVNKKAYKKLLRQQKDVQLKHEHTLLHSTKEKTLLQCKHCGKFTVSYYLRQTRSADEPMTCFANCHNCDKSWKQ